MSADGPLGAAIGWIATVLLGSAATAMAVIAVVGLGLAMLQGHLSIRDSLRVMLGCFILFGAPAIAHGLLDSIGGSTSAPDPIVPVDHPPLAPDPRAPRYDPYAGAAVAQN